MRVHSDPESAAWVRGAGARAMTYGDDVAVAHPQIAEDPRTMAHEAAHIQQARLGGPQAEYPPFLGQPRAPHEREATRFANAVLAARSTPALTAVDPATVMADDGPVCTPDVRGSFVLDPALENPATPDGFTTSVRMQAPGVEGSDQYVDVRRDVLSAYRLFAAAIPDDQVYLSEMEASEYRDRCSVDDQPPNVILGQQVFTASGSFMAMGTADGYVFADRAVPEAVAAGAVAVLETEGGTILLDAGLQITDEDAGVAVGMQLATQISYSGVTAVSEAVLSPGAPDGHAMPHIASQVSIGSVRVTQDQLANGISDTLAQIQAGQDDYRRWLQSVIEEQLDTEVRAQWEANRAISPNRSIRASQWQAYRDAQVAAQLGDLGQPSLELLETGEDGRMRFADRGAIGKTATSPEDGIDLTGLEWEPSDDEQLLIVSGGSIGITSSSGALLTLKGERAPTRVPNLDPVGPTGPRAAAPTASPMMAMASVGKEGLTLVRTSEGRGVLVDAGGRAAVVLEGGLARMQAELGVTSIDRILVTHPHHDHYRQLVEVIKSLQLRATDLVISEAWQNSSIVRRLRTTTDADLLALGYGANMPAGVAVDPATPVTVTRVNLTEGELTLYQNRDAADAYSRASSSRRSSLADSSSFMAVAGDPTTGNRALIVGDMRGEDITAMRDGLGEEGFGRALEGVRNIRGLGHHFSMTAGRTEADIEGMETLIREAMHRNGEVTITVQTTRRFAFGSEADPGPNGANLGQAEGALLRWAQALGARVVFVERPGEAHRGATVDSTGAAAQYGQGGSFVFEGSEAVRDLVRRIRVLSEAERTVQQSEEFGPRALGLEGQTAASLQTGLQAELATLRGYYDALTGQASADLYDARGQTGTQSARASDQDLADYRAERTVPGQTAASILEQARTKGAIESSLSTEVLDRLRLAVAGGPSTVSRIELASTPRSVVEALEGATGLSEGRRSALAQRYREMAELTHGIEGELVPENQRLELLGRARLLRDELRQAVEEMPQEGRAPLEAELGRINGVVARLGSDAETTSELGRDMEGRLTRTEITRLRHAQQGEAVVRGFHQVGRALGGLMVYHSVQELGATAQDYEADQMNVPEALLRTAHAGYGINIGVRMVRAAPKPVAGAGGVRGWEFGVLALIDVSAAALGDYDTTEDHDAAVLGSVIHNSINLLCMAAGQAIMTKGAVAPMHPLAKLVVMGLGLAVMTKGPDALDFVSNLFGYDVDEQIIKWTSFPPGEVTDVHLNINEVLDEYEVIIGARRLAAHDDDPLRALGADDPAALREAAEDEISSRTDDVGAKELELIGLFESAYAVARTSYVGLRALDALAARFTRLRHLAMNGRTDDDQRSEIQERFDRMDDSLSLTDASERDIRSMPQWRHIDEKAQEVREHIYDVDERTIDWDRTFESLNELNLMMENARYRLEPGGRWRTNPIVGEGEARNVYVDQLQPREYALSEITGRLQALTGASFAATVAPSGAPRNLSPDGALRNLIAARRSYDSVVDEAETTLRAAIAGFAGPEAWNDPARLARQSEDARNQNPALFHRIRIAEFALQSSARQATTSLTLAESRPNQVVRESIEREVSGADSAIAARRMQRGILLPSELDSILMARLRQTDAVFAAQIDAAYPGNNTATTRPMLTDAEQRALQTDRLEGQGRIITTDQTLRSMREATQAHRSLDANDPAYAAGHRNIDRQYALLSNPYNYYSEGWVLDTMPEASYPSGLQPLVTVIENPARLGTRSTWSWMPATYARVRAVNADAYQIMGNSELLVRTDQLRATSAEGIRQRASQLQGESED